MQRPPNFPHLPCVAKPCELCDALHAELDSARVEAMALHQDRAARVGDTPAASLERAAWFKEAMTRWEIAALNLEYHRADDWNGGIFLTR
jgi:hypothetical protein